MSTANVITEELGPRGKRRVRIGTAVALVVFALVLWWAYRKLDENGQTEIAGWRALTEWATVKFLFGGLVGTIEAAVVAAIIATVLGFALALMRLAKSRAVQIVAVAWVELFRALPLLFLIFGVFYLDTSFSRGRGGDALLGTFWSIVVALVLYNSAVLSEIFRAGVRSLDSGQSEAAHSVGMSYWQTMFLVVLPQAVRRMIPALVAQMATLTKDVSLGFVISYVEFVRRGSGTANFGATTNFQAYVMIGVVYFVLVWAIARLARFLEGRQRTSVKVDAPAGGAGEEATDDAMSVAATESA
ncbi:amino acid ABC transporter permease [Ilumatobacter sp.]|uniref:amino acid ABC transporter permease n=1 Tax=Ilumatobacter sp. TaxID=1967498 RepID=UPI003B5233E1